MEAIFTALGYLLDPVYWVVLLSVVALAALASAIPGMNAFLVMALAFPFILFEVDEPAIGLVALATISGVSNTLDSVPAILIGQPNAATQVTFLEGHQLARRGYAAHTLGAVYAVSALGGIVGAVLLTIAIPVARPFVLKFGFSEIAATGMVGIAMVIVLSRGAMVRGLIAALVGMLLGIIGSFGRLTVAPFFVPMPLVPFIIGLFALPELVDLMMSRRPVAAEGGSFGRSEVLRGVGYGVSRWKMTVRQSTFGVLLGAIPGVGSAVVDWLSYAFGVILTKDRSQFGKGSLDGVLFAESAQNAKEAGAALPTLALGVPGAPTWALVVVAMIPYGVAPGPEMLGTHAHITILLVITLALANLVISGIGVGVTGFLARLTAVPYPIIGAVVIPVALLAAFVDTTSWRGIQIVLGVGVMGLVMKRYSWPRPPMILGFILVDVIERNHFNALSIYEGYWGALTRPLTIVILFIAVAVSVVLLCSVMRMERETAVSTDGTDVGPERSIGWKARLLNADVLIPSWSWRASLCCSPTTCATRCRRSGVSPCTRSGSRSSHWAALRGTVARSAGPPESVHHHGHRPRQQGDGRGPRGGAADGGPVCVVPAGRHDRRAQVGRARVRAGGAGGAAARPRALAHGAHRGSGRRALHLRFPGQHPLHDLPEAVHPRMVVENFS